MLRFAEASARICSKDLIVTGSPADDLPPAQAEVAGSPLDEGREETGVLGLGLSPGSSGGGPIFDICF